MIVMIAVIAEKKKKFSDRSDHSDHMENTLQRSQRSYGKHFPAIAAIIWKPGLRGLQNADICNFSGSLKPGLHMIATIAVIAAIGEKNKSSTIAAMIAIQCGNHFPEIATAVQRSLRQNFFYLSDRCRCDRQKVLSI